MLKSFVHTFAGTLGFKIVRSSPPKSSTVRDPISNTDPVLKEHRLKLRKAVVVDVSGGLCNQMMCYKAARIVADWSGSSIVIGSRFYNNYSQVAGTHWNFQLHHYPLIYDLMAIGNDLMDEFACNSSLVVSQGMIDRAETDGFTSLIQIIKDSDVVFIDFALALFFWRNQNFFPLPASCRFELQLDVSRKLTETDLGILNLIQNHKNPAAIHVRRGDFLGGDNDLAVQPDFFARAADFILGRFPDAHFFVFSDDMEWCREILGQFVPICYVDHNSIEYGYRDLYLASRCKHFVLTGHSTFSHHMVELSNPTADRIVISNTLGDIITGRKLEKYHTPDYCVEVCGPQESASK